jgi:hypothetical protein
MSFIYHQSFPLIASPPTQVVAVQLCISLSSHTCTEIWSFESKINFLPIDIGHSIQIFRNREDAFDPSGNQHWLVSGTIIDIVGCHQGQMVFRLQEGASRGHRYTMLAIPTLLTTVSWDWPQRWWHSCRYIARPSVKPLLAVVKRLRDARKGTPTSDLGTILEFSGRDSSALAVERTPSFYHS